MTYTSQERRRIMDAAYRRRRKYLTYIGAPTSFIPADRAADHVKRLYELGWSTKALAEMTTGVTDTTVTNLLRGRHSTIERATEAAVLAIPDTLAPSLSVPGEMWIPTLGATRRVQALMRLGWPHAEMRKRAPSTVHLARGSYRQMTTVKWRGVAAMYEALSMRLGPSKITAQRAAVSGYAPPLAWQDIDNPDEVPSGHYRPPTGRRASSVAARIADLEHFIGNDMTLDGACRELGVTRDALWKWADRHQQRHLYERLARLQRRGGNQHTISGSGAA